MEESRAGIGGPEGHARGSRASRWRSSSMETVAAEVEEFKKWLGDSC